MAAVATATHIKCWSLSQLIILILKVDLHPEQDAAFSTIKYKSQLSMALVDMQNSSIRGAQNPFGQKDHDFSNRFGKQGHKRLSQTL